MELNKAALGGLVVGCLAAAAGGGYLAVRVAQPVHGPAVVPGPAAPAGASSETSAAEARTGSAFEGAVSAEPAKRPVAPVASAAPAPRAAVTRAAETRSASTTRNRPGVVAPAASDPPERSMVPPAQATAPAASGSMWETRPVVQPAAPEVREPEPPPAPAVEYVDLTVPSDAVLGLQLERYVSSDLARLEDRVDARVTRDVRVGDRVAIPAGSSVRGAVVDVDRGGRMRGRPRLAVRFHTVVLADGTQLALKTDTVVREGQSPTNETAAKIGGGAAGGAILGAILGGGRGAAIGGAIGAGAGTAATMTNDPKPATLPAGTTLTVRMQAPVTVTVQKE